MKIDILYIYQSESLFLIKVLAYKYSKFSLKDDEIEHSIGSTIYY